MKTILIAVDMQQGFLKKEHTRQLSEKVEKLLERKIFDVVIGTRFLNASNSMYEKFFQWNELETEEERAIPENLQKHMDYIEDKYIYNCVHGSFIQRLCQLNDGSLPEKVFVIGVDTDCCVLTIATSLFEHNIRPVVLTQYCASNGGKDSHNAGILCMKRLIGEGQVVEEEIRDRESLE